MHQVSPLFAVEADALFSEGRLDEALTLCNAGLETFPDYAGAYLLKIRILTALGHNQEAEAAILQGISRSRNSAALRVMSQGVKITESDDVATASKTDTVMRRGKEVDKYQDIIIARKTEASDELESFQTITSAQLRDIEWKSNHCAKPLAWRAVEISLIPWPDIAVTRRRLPAQIFRPKLIEFPAFPEIRRRLTTKQEIMTENPIDEFVRFEKFSAKRHTPLEELAQRLERARIPPRRDDIADESAAAVPEFVTETMAAIYEKQGAYAQALKAYQILARNEPEKLPRFQPRINELKLMVER